MRGGDKGARGLISRDITVYIFRNNRDNEGKYIAQCLEEIKQELRQVLQPSYSSNIS